MSQFFVPENDQTRERLPPEKLDEIFNDFEAHSNIVGLYDLLLKIDRRNNPHYYRQPELPKSEPSNND